MTHNLKKDTAMHVRHAKMRDFDYLRTKEPKVAPAELKRRIVEKAAIVVERDQVLVGCLLYNLFWSKIPFMNLLWVEEPFRGKGMGTAMVAFWENELRARGFPRAMTSSQSNERGQNLYRKLGYSDCGGLTLPGEPLEIVFFKDL